MAHTVFDFCCMRFFYFFGVNSYLCKRLKGAASAALAGAQMYFLVLQAPDNAVDTVPCEQIPAKTGFPLMNLARNISFAGYEDKLGLLRDHLVI